PGLGSASNCLCIEDFTDAATRVGIVCSDVSRARSVRRALLLCAWSVAPIFEAVRKAHFCS
ncbi:MAG: hypothetical protein ORN20_07175, partial [Candidatus Nanopelagicales bacterium]|nr:hypothetical protein [Candidatus Nanopelagicales bacterium]